MVSAALGADVDAADVKGRCVEDDNLPSDAGLKFDNDTRDTLISRYAEELLKAHPDAFDPRSEGAIFAGVLEGYADYARRFIVAEKPEKQQRRRERVEAFANAIDRLLDAAAAMDDPALGYALWRGLQEYDPNQAEGREGVTSIFAAFEIQRFEIPELAKFALGVRKAIADLPPIDTWRSSPEIIAKWIEDCLGRAGIPCSMSDTGLAAQALSSVLELAGAPADSCKYWLQKAMKSPDSWANVSARVQGKNER